MTNRVCRSSCRKQNDGVAGLPISGLGSVFARKSVLKGTIELPRAKEITTNMLEMRIPLPSGSAGGRHSVVSDVNTYAMLSVPEYFVPAAFGSNSGVVAKKAPGSGTALSARTIDGTDRNVVARMAAFRMFLDSFIVSPSCSKRTRY